MHDEEYAGYVRGQVSHSFERLILFTNAVTPLINRFIATRGAEF